jgi:hypothetical protein
LPYAPRSAGSELACTLRVCPLCLGDLVAQQDATGSFFLCVQCQQRVDRARRPLRDHVPRLTSLVLTPTVITQAEELLIQQ